jgi:predicted lipid-binding transport protein (Tim44 family)
MEYWRNEREDAQRAEMLEEMFQQAAAEEDAKGLKTVTRPSCLEEPKEHPADGKTD